MVRGPCGRSSARCPFDLSHVKIPTCRDESGSRTPREYPLRRRKITTVAILFDVRLNNLYLTTAVSNSEAPGQWNIHESKSSNRRYIIVNFDFHRRVRHGSQIRSISRSRSDCSRDD